MISLAKNQTHTAEITGYSSAGSGVCRIAGRAVFVDFALVGEVWEVLILKVSTSAVYGKGLKLLKPSPERRGPECPVFGKCGGCGLLHMSYNEELSFKLSRVNDAIQRIAGLDFKIPEILPADDGKLLRYRNKAIFNIAYDKNGKVRAGFYRPRSHELVPAGDCLIQPELSVRAANALCFFMNEKRIEPYDEKTGKGAVRHLFFRLAAKRSDALAVIVSAKGLKENTAPLVDALRSACPELTGIVLCINKSAGNTVLDGQFHTLWGRNYIEDELCGLTFRVSPDSFYQINPAQAEKLYERALEYASPNGGETVLDLYCGAGTISLALARGAKMVYGAEIVPSAVENARENARLNNIENAEFLLGDAAKAAVELKSRGIRPNTVVVDPPRKGLEGGLIDTIAQMSPERVVYVSCDPGTLARDMALFSEKGYIPMDGAAVDMFTKTANVECVVLLSRINYAKI